MSGERSNRSRSAKAAARKPATPLFSLEFETSLGELLTELGLQLSKRDAPLQFLDLADGKTPEESLCLDGALLRRCGALEAIPPEWLIPESQELLVAGTVSSLFRLLPRLPSRQHITLLIQAPLLPAARGWFERQGCAAVREVLRGRDGAFLALSCTRHRGAHLLPHAASLLTLDRFGRRVPQEQLGELAAPTPEGFTRMGLWARKIDAPCACGRSASRLRDAGLTSPPLRFPDGELLDGGELWGLLCEFPLLWASVTQPNRQALHGRVAPLPDEDGSELEKRLRFVLGQKFSELAIHFVDSKEEPETPLCAECTPKEIFAYAVSEPENETSSEAWRSLARAMGFAPEARLALIFHGGSKDEAAWRRAAKNVLFDIKIATKAETKVHVWLHEHPRDGLQLYASREESALAALRRAVETGEPSETLSDVVLFGLCPETETAIAVRALPESDFALPLWIESARCDGCGRCLDACLAHCLSLSLKGPALDAARCVRCYACADACPAHALRPTENERAALSGQELNRRLRWISGEEDAWNGEGVQARLQRWRMGETKDQSGTDRKGPIILGLAMTTLTEHAAALLVNGELHGAAEEERFSRIKHLGYAPAGRSGASLASDPGMKLFEPLPWRAAEWALKEAGLSVEDLDAVAINGMPYRLRHSFSRDEAARPPELRRSGKVFFVPHHLAHAACAFAQSGFEDAAVLSIDGRGDRETAAFYWGHGNELSRVFDLPFFPDRSAGGVYETVTRALGFGAFGQGSTMALAAFGEPKFDLSDFLAPGDEPLFSEWRAAWAAQALSASEGAAQKNLAASVQDGMERAVAALLHRGWGRNVPERLAMAGGVALNCRMNGRLRKELGLKDFFVPPGANDAGTAVGAALMAHRELTGKLPRTALRSAALGPAYSDEAILRWLKAGRIPCQEPERLEEEVARRLAAGQVVGWFQGRMEFGPRALGCRSLLADPRKAELKDRLNRMKSRQNWRPFGGSVLAGRQSEWFEEDWDSLFMLFAVAVKKEKQARIPVLVHADGSTRPQIVYREVMPRYHELISAFERLTGVPMIVNTSFNRGGEPIVTTPAEALRSFMAMKADALVLGRALILRENLPDALRRG